MVCKHALQEPQKSGGMEIVSSWVQLHHFVFLNNSGIIGGEIYVKNSNITLLNTDLVQNTATLHGGGLMAYSTDCSFYHNNVSTLPADLAGTGGGVYFFGVHNLLAACEELCVRQQPRRALQRGHFHGSEREFSQVRN